MACQAPQSMEFSSPEYWSELLSPTPGDLAGPGIEPVAPASPVLAGGFFTSSTKGLCCSAKSLQSCPTLCDPTDASPPGSPVPGGM